MFFFVFSQQWDFVTKHLQGSRFTGEADSLVRNPREKPTASTKHLLVDP